MENQAQTFDALVAAAPPARFAGIRRDYTPTDVARLGGSLPITHTLAENGATEHELMAIYDWDSPKQAALYTRKANRKQLVAGAMHKLIKNESVPPERAVASGGTMRGKRP